RKSPGRSFDGSAFPVHAPTLAPRPAKLNGAPALRRAPRMLKWSSSLGVIWKDMASPHPMIFDRGLLRARRRRAAALGPATFLLPRVAAELAERLGAVLRRFECAVDLGTATGAVRRALAVSGKAGIVIAAGTGVADASEADFAVVADEEALP